MSIFAGIAAGANLYVQQAVEKKKTALEQQLEIAKERRMLANKIADEDRARKENAAVIKTPGIREVTPGNIRTGGFNEYGDFIDKGPASPDEIASKKRSDDKEKAAIDYQLAQTGYLKANTGLRDVQAAVLPIKTAADAAVDASKVPLNQARTGAATRSNRPKAEVPKPLPTENDISAELIKLHGPVIADYVKSDQMSTAEAYEAALYTARAAIEYAKSGRPYNVKAAYLDTLRRIAAGKSNKGS